MTEKNCENCGSVHCYTHEPKYQVCKEGSLWQPLEEKLSIGEMHEYAHKLFDCFNELDFKTTFNKAIQAFYLEEGLYVVRSEANDVYQYTLVKACSEETARVEYEKALEVYEKYTKKRSVPHILETVYGGCF